MRWNTDKVFHSVPLFVTEALRNVKTMAGFDSVLRLDDDTCVTIQRVSSGQRVAVQVQRNGQMIAEVRVVRGQLAVSVFYVKGIALHPAEQQVIDLVAGNLPLLYKTKDVETSFYDHLKNSIDTIK